MNDSDLVLTGTRAGTGEEVFGIDLGTTYSAIAWLDSHGKPETLGNLDGRVTTPSVVYFAESEETYQVGEHAKEWLKDEPQRVVEKVKEHMGDPDWRYTTPEGREYSAIEISAIILKKLVEDAAVQTGCPVKNVVITCPAYFGTNEHEATKEAGRHAGLNVVEVIDEPVAAAYAYGITAKEAQTVLVYDLGGGTFDVTIIKIDPMDATAPIRVVAKGGDPQLGGKQWDEAFVQLLAKKWGEGTDETLDLESDPGFKAELTSKVERHKISLSQLTAVTVPGVRGKSLKVTREEFDAETSGLLEQTIIKTRQTLDEAAKMAGVETFEFDTLLCVGGSSLMPQVAARLRAEFGKEPKLKNPNECVAQGAAVWAGLRAVGGGQTKNILGKSYGIKAVRRKPGGDREDVVSFLLLKNQPQDDEGYTDNRHFHADEDDQHTIDIRVMESEAGLWEEAKADAEKRGEDVDPNGWRVFPYDDLTMAEIKTGSLILPPGCKEGDIIAVTYRVDSGMVLHVTAVHERSGQKVELQCTGNVKKPEKPMSKDMVFI